MYFCCVPTSNWKFKWMPVKQNAKLVLEKKSVVNQNSEM